MVITDAFSMLKVNEIDGQWRMCAWCARLHPSTYADVECKQYTRQVNTHHKYVSALLDGTQWTTQPTAVHTLSLSLFTTQTQLHFSIKTTTMRCEPERPIILNPCPVIYRCTRQRHVTFLKSAKCYCGGVSSDIATNVVALSPLDKANSTLPTPCRKLAFWGCYLFLSWLNVENNSRIPSSVQMRHIWREWPTLTINANELVLG